MINFKFHKHFFGFILDPKFLLLLNRSNNLVCLEPRKIKMSLLQVNGIFKYWKSQNLKSLTKKKGVMPLSDITAHIRSLLRILHFQFNVNEELSLKSKTSNLK